jgi:hypothetical protein
MVILDKFDLQEPIIELAHDIANRMPDVRAPNLATALCVCLVVLGAAGYVICDKGFEVRTPTPIRSRNPSRWI